MGAHAKSCSQVAREGAHIGTGANRGPEGDVPPIDGEHVQGVDRDLDWFEFHRHTSPRQAMTAFPPDSLG